MRKFLLISIVIIVITPALIMAQEQCDVLPDITITGRLDGFLGSFYGYSTPKSGDKIMVDLSNIYNLTELKFNETNRYIPIPGKLKTCSVEYYPNKKWKHIKLAATRDNATLEIEISPVGASNGIRMYIAVKYMNKYSGFGLVQGKYNENKLSCSLKTKVSYQSGLPVSIDFSFTNNTDRDLYFLNWGTAFEGFPLNLSFDVKRGGKQLSYIGPMAKRGKPTKDNYIKVKANETVTKKLELSKYYRLVKPGNYQVTYIGGVGDICSCEKAVPRDPMKWDINRIKSNTIKFEIKRIESNTIEFEKK